MQYEVTECVADRRPARDIIRRQRTRPAEVQSWESSWQPQRTHVGVGALPLACNHCERRLFPYSRGTYVRSVPLWVCVRQLYVAQHCQEVIIVAPHQRRVHQWHQLQPYERHQGSPQGGSRCTRRCR